MHPTLDPNRPTLPRRAGMLAAATLCAGMLVAGCGGSSNSLTAATLGSAEPSASAAGPATRSTSTAPAVTGSGPLAFAKCMRANGVPNFPDPSPSGAFRVGNGVNPASPAVRAAQAKCQKFMAGGLPGSGPGPSEQTLLKLRQIAVCMRAHGVSAFPDPRTTMPANPAASGAQVITDYDGAILLFPPTLNLEAPAYREALKACGAPPLGLPH